MQVRGSPAELQEHVQVEAAAAEVARGGGLDDRLADQHRQDRRPGQETEEAYVDRGVGEGRA